MAQDDLEKSVQDIKDPAARKAAYYTKQREVAERKSTFDKGSADTAAKINSKLGKKDKAAEYSQESGRLKKYGTIPGAAANFLDKIVKPTASVGENFGPIGEVKAGSAIGGALSKAAKYIPEAENAIGSGVKALEGKASQWLGKARPAASKEALPAAKKALSGTKSKVYSGAEKKALPSSKSPKALESKSSSSMPAKLKGTGKAKSSPTKRDNVFGTRLNPQTGKPVGRGGMEIVSRAVNRSERKAATKATGEMNQAASKQSPRSRSMRNMEIGGKKVGSSKKGNYAPAKLKAAG